MMNDLGVPGWTLPEELDVGEVLEVVTRALEEQGQDLEYLQGMQMAVPGAGKLYGVRVPQLRTIAKQLAKKYRDQEQDLVQFAQVSWAQGSREHRLIALFVLAGRKKLTPERRWKLGVEFLPDVEDWEICDQLCHALLGPTSRAGFNRDSPQGKVLRGISKGVGPANAEYVRGSAE